MATKIFKIKYVPHVFLLNYHCDRITFEESCCVATCDMDIGE